MKKPKKKLILLELNEINFDIVERYVAPDPGRFPFLKALLTGPKIHTYCEKKYEELEPWIQWVSVHTGKAYPEHRVFRLGDIVGSDVPQFFEQLEQAGYKVGAISPMNTENRLRKPAYFIPDPWTQTPTDSSWWSQSLALAIKQAVNDNAQARISKNSALRIFLGLMRFARPGHFLKYLSLVVESRRKPWLKSLALDLFLHDLHWTLFNSKRPDFSALFLNAGAHIQHHYFFNAEPIRKSSSIKNPSWYLGEFEDPVGDVLGLYDLIVGEYLARSDVDVLIATGLSQKPFDRVKFYYRLKDHVSFLRGLDIKFKAVFPRMTRDFLIEFENDQQATAAQGKLAGLVVESEDSPLFGKIDNRGDSLFVTLTYPKEITSTTWFGGGDRKWPLFPEVSFVAIKNGMHEEKGFAFFTPGVLPDAPIDGSHVAALHKTILAYFGLTGSFDETKFSS
ncbi:MAG: hypothetical protein FJ184_06400 [Gammaproteobacteria bacterium]|nr:hypothetical protein [Gammaproteobacteria bacterium]